MPVIPEPATPPLSGAGLIFSPMSASASVAVPFKAWWLIVPEALELSIPLRRVQDSSSSAASGLTSSYTVNQNLQEQISHAFGRKHAVITHGDLQGDEFVLNAVFFGDTEWKAFRTVRESFKTVLAQSDQASGEQWYVDLGATRPASVIRAADRTTNPIRVVSLQCVSVDAP